MGAAMKFSRLRLLGFKSFVEPGEFVIERGLTGVVGPNGCGKSNLVEALRWVMGESSYKNMRASGMDDVIFSGSATRPARNTAEVTLFLDNSDRNAPASFNDEDELQVSRRIEREAGSIYRINGREVRAKDVQLLFADQSTGARSPSMVGQGRIGELIQAKPQARRALLEEAAGISGLHTRRHEAELRLRAAEQNLERLDDVVGELESQIESLKRQARQASRFKHLSAQIRKAEALLLHLRWVMAKTQEAEAKAVLAQATVVVGERSAQQLQAAKEQAVSAHGLPPLREAEASAASTLQRLTIARSQLEEEAGRVRSRRIELEKRLAQFDADIEREEHMVRDNADVVQRLNEEEASLTADDVNTDEREAKALAAVETTRQSLNERETALSKLTLERAAAMAAHTQAGQVLKENEERQQRLRRQIADIERESAEIAGKISALPDVVARQSALEQAEHAAQKAEEQASEAEKQVMVSRAREAEARPPVDKARAEFQAAQAELRTLSQMLHAVIGGDGFHAVVDEIHVQPGYETALGAALGEDLDMPLDADAPAHWGQTAASEADPKLPDGVQPLSGFVQAPKQLSRRLAQIGIVDMASGPALQKVLKVGQRLVSREGAMWRWDGLTASADAPTAAALRLAQKNRLTDLESRISTLSKAVQTAESVLSQAEAATKQALEVEKAARDFWRVAQRTVAHARDELAHAEKATNEFSSRKAVLAESAQRLAEALAEAETGTERARHALSSLDDISLLQAALNELAQTVAQDRKLYDEARSAYDALKREVETRRRRLAAIHSERAAWETRVENARTHIAALRERRAETFGEYGTLADVPDEIDARRRTLTAELSQAESARAEAFTRMRDAENRQAELDKAATGAIQLLAESREARARAEERLSAADDRRREAEARISEVLNVPPHLALRHAGLDEGEKLPEPTAVERDLERLKMERERLGAVNLRAEEEQKELAERKGTIASEREDVIEAIRALRQAIQNLNREGRERLLAAFNVVNAQFQRLFSHLFGGGTAELQLVESEDPLDAGLEILARPPGKKPQTMTLLSGGEQALTAMALIFAVFLTNPAPICVLDEVDAPLDDHNVERFCNLMDEMASTTETRFIVITHNPITMARMNRLFGVTMAEQGVSQLVSVDLQTAEQMVDAV